MVILAPRCTVFRTGDKADGLVVDLLEDIGGGVGLGVDGDGHLVVAGVALGEAEEDGEVQLAVDLDLEGVDLDATGGGLGNEAGGNASTHGAHHGLVGAEAAVATCNLGGLVEGGGGEFTGEDRVLEAALPLDTGVPA